MRRDRIGDTERSTCSQSRGVSYCLREFAHGVGRAANEGGVLRVILVDEEHGESVTSCVDGEEVLWDIRTIPLSALDGLTSWDTTTAS